MPMLPVAGLCIANSFAVALRQVSPRRIPQILLVAHVEPLCQISEAQTGAAKPRPIVENARGSAEAPHQAATTCKSNSYVVHK